MRIMSHRGYWITSEERNSLTAFERSFSKTFGTETDIRDFAGELVISHDIAETHCMTVDNFLRVYCNHDPALPLALNIKEDGLQRKLEFLLMAYKITNYFVFDMSIPDHLGYLNAGLRSFSRQSEYEPSPVFYDQAAGIWMDSFIDDWIEEQHIAPHLATGKQVCLVSPELHHRHHKPFWNRLSAMTVVSSDNLMLCTDYPEEAKEFFHG